jgi:hypothetical protein
MFVSEIQVHLDVYIRKNKIVVHNPFSILIWSIFLSDPNYNFREKNLVQNMCIHVGDAILKHPLK